MANETEPYRALLHYDETITEGAVWIGYGKDLAPACGQREWIAVTPSADLVECKRCLAIVAPDVSA